MNTPEMLRQKMRALFREPLLHFIVAGLLVFLLSLWRGGGVDPASRVIVISQDTVLRLAASWEQIWRRPPNQTEIDGLIRDYIKEEIYYREAKRLGLDEDDTVIRRRLRSKMEFLAAAQAENANPDTATLQRWLDQYPQRFADEADYSFDQIYLGETGADGTTAILRLLEAGGDWRKLGRPISLPRSMDAAAHSDIARQFGDPFARSLALAPQGSWTGPIKSGFGVHLIRVRNIRPAAKPILAEVRQAVENDWRINSVKEREDKTYQALLDGYSIKIVKP